MANTAVDLALACPGWRSGPVRVASTRRRRRRGLRGAGPGFGLLLRTKSVHGAGLDRSLWAVPLDGDGRVRGAAVLEPGGLLVDRGAAWFLELPIDRAPPPPGSVLRVHHRS